MENNDSLIVEENDGTLTISWDQNDPKYSWLNDLTEDQLRSILTQGLEDILKELDDEVH